jgi:hypothetical protein
MERSRRQGASKNRMRAIAFLSAMTLAACSGDASDERARRHAAARLKADPASLRVTSQSDLDSQRHVFHLVTSDANPPLLVVIPRTGEPFDGETENAFTRVARAEEATARLSQIGAERIALWFGGLGNKVCPMPASDQAHFADVERLPSGIRVSYPAGKNSAGKRTCEIDLAPDGSLSSARLVEQQTSTASRSWKSGM